VPWLLLGATLIFTFGKRISALHPVRPRSLTCGLALMAGIAIYGGYFGGGIGILMLASFGMLGMHHIHAMNGLRSILAAAINGVSVIAFVVAGAIDWEAGTVMAIAASCGGYFGARVARGVRPAAVRSVVLALSWGMTAWFMFNPS
jgi:uncharacterized membrane protein YfcA